MRNNFLFSIILALICVAFPLMSRAQAPVIEQASHEKLAEVIRSSPAELSVVNFWATWCVPCRQEFPDLIRIGKDYADRGVQVIFVSADFEEDLPVARDFLKEQKVTDKTYIKTGNDQAFINAFSENWSGALPATFIYEKGGKLREFWEGKSTYEELAARIEQLLD